MRALVLGLVVCFGVVCGGAAGAGARERYRDYGGSAGGGSAGGVVGSASGRSGEAFDYYLLSLSVAPSFCALSAGNASRGECRALTAADYQRTPLTIHGLWPNVVRGGVQPHDCAGPAFAVSDGLQAQLRRWMPAGPALERYEWGKHGVCSGMSPEAYFGAEARLAEQANGVIGPALLAQGRMVRVDALVQAVAAGNPAVAAAMVVDCQTARGGGDPLVVEIRVALSKDLQPIAASSVGLGQNSGCRGGAGAVPVP